MEDPTFYPHWSRSQVYAFQVSAGRRPDDASLENTIRVREMKTLTLEFSQKKKAQSDDIIVKLIGNNKSKNMSAELLHRYSLLKCEQTTKTSWISDESLNYEREIAK